MVVQPPSADLSIEQIQHWRAALARADRRLLDATIRLPEDDWTRPSLLPGWSRAHVATHIARNADALVRLAEGAVSGTPQPMYPDDRDAEIEAGAGRPGIALHTDLDISATRLAEAFDRLTGANAWSETVTMRHGLSGPAALLPLLRLLEVVLHHVDLDVGYRVTDIDPETAEICLAGCARRFAARESYPALRLITDNAQIAIGDHDQQQPVVVSGRANLLLGWITGRSGTDGLDGADIELPGFG